MALTRRSLDLVILGASAFALLMSLLYARSVKLEFAELASGPSMEDAPDGTLRDDWMTARLANADLTEISALLRDKRYGEADERMQKLLLRFPKSDAADEARRILTQINLDSFSQKETGDEIGSYTVKSGDSPLAIANRKNSSYLSLLALNGDASLKRLRPGDKLLFRPLNDKLLIDLSRGVVELRRGDAFLAEFPIVGKRLPDGPGISTAKVSEIMGYQGRERHRPIDKGFSSARKVIGLSGVNWIVGSDSAGEANDRFEGVFLSDASMAELITLIRRGNEVAIQL